MSKELEALKNIRNGSFDDYHSTSFEEIYSKDFDVIEEALKRNEPMKPTPSQRPEMFRGRCPICERLFYRELEPFDYCPHCGQKLDWSESE